MIRRLICTRTRFQVFTNSSSCCRCSLNQVRTPIVRHKEKGDTVRIEPRPPPPSTYRLCARTSRKLFPPKGRGDGTRMQSVLGESRASCPLSRTRPLQPVYAAAELVCRRRVVVLESMSRVLLVLLLWDVLYYCTVVLHINPIQ